ncbi:hypothetical protein BJX99DRAFT_258602 [Aspergillus californicus]
MPNFDRSFQSSVQPLPQRPDPNQMNLTWPLAVTYRGRPSEGEGQGEASQPAPDNHTRPMRLQLPRLPDQDSIRLIRLEHGNPEDLLHADFQIVRINQVPPPVYHALSYAYFADNAHSLQTCPVLIGNYWDVIFVSWICGQALRQLRHATEDRLTWEDSLCIDSADLEEKSSQAPLERAALNQDARNKLQVLFQYPYFTCIWTLHDMLMARKIRFVSNSGLSVLWPRWPFGNPYPDVNIPSCLIGDRAWNPIGRDLLRVLVNASPYKHFDPRDKVLPVESVYAGIAAYLLKNCGAVDLFALAGQRRPAFGLPSWVPDWSQSLSLPDLDTFYPLGIGRETDELLRGAVRIKFINRSDAGRTVEVEYATGAMRIHGVRLCRVSDLGNHTRYVGASTIVQLSTPRGFLIISIPHQNYEVHEFDYVYLLDGYHHPVILRDTDNQSKYSLVTPCVLSIQCPDQKLDVPWYRQQRLQENPAQLTVSALTLEDKESLRQLHLQFEPMATPDWTGPCTLQIRQIRCGLFYYLLLSQTGIRKVEHLLLAEWHKLRSKVGGMLRDQTATWQLLQSVMELKPEERSGENEMSIQ